MKMGMNDLNESDHNHKLCLLLVAHGDYGEHEVDQVERAKEDHDGEEDHVDRTSCCHHLNKLVLISSN